MKRVLVMCNNPTTDGPLEWDGHEMVAYVDVTPPVRTQAEHKARLTALKTSLDREIASMETEELDDEDDDAHLVTIKSQREELETLLTIPLPVEDLSKLYSVGINSVPRDLLVDVVLVAGCPLDPRSPSDFKDGSVQADVRTAVQRHLRPGGEVYLLWDWKSYDKTYHDAFAALVDFVRTETQTIGGAYYVARGSLPEQTYSVLVRKAGGGRRRKTHRRRRGKKSRHTRKH